jgi:hypothetical protein
VAAASNAEIACTSASSPRMKRVEWWFAALRELTPTAPATPPLRAGQHDPPLHRLENRHTTDPAHARSSARQT